MLLESPSDASDFDKYEVDGIIVYVLCTLKADKDGIHIKYNKRFVFEDLVVDGVIY
ncbi:MAG: hypothetical protein P1P64_09015 [Treponemataceae bacterium]